MTGPKTKKIRLDEILLKEDLVSEDQIKKALLSQKNHVGKFGSQLLYHRYIDEPKLVRALSLQFNCDGVVLSGLDVPGSVANMIPQKVAISRKVMPFEYDPETSVLKIACEDPCDPGLLAELNFVVPGKNIKLYVAAELALKTAINKYYLRQNAWSQDKLLPEIPDLAADHEATALMEGTKSSAEKTNASKSILLVTAEEFSASLIQSLLERDGYLTRICGSADKALELISDSNYHSVFIEKTVDGHQKTLIEKIRLRSPQTAIRLFTTAADLIMDDETTSSTERILQRNLELLTSLLSSKDGLQSNHSGTVGRYAGKLCKKLGLPARNRMIVTNAAYLHDLARYYYRDIDTKDYRVTIELSKRLLESFDYSPEVIGVLEAMYRDVKNEHSANSPWQDLGGNILTIVDIFCENIPLDHKLTLDKFDAIKKRLRDLAGRLFVSEVVEAFIAMIQREILNLETADQIGQVMIFSDQRELSYPLELRLKNEGFRIVTEQSPQAFVELYVRSRPDILILALKGESEKIIATIDELATKGVDYRKSPTILVVETPKISKLTSIFERGIEDIVTSDASSDLLVVKIRKFQADAIARHGSQGVIGAETAGAKGRLADMNIIDLMQALAPGRKTVKITVIPADGSKEKLVIFLDKGNISFAELGSLRGPEAIYKGISWTNGSWVVEPVPPEKLPKSNSQLSNDAILMEGAYRLDETMRAGKP